MFKPYLYLLLGHLKSMPKWGLGLLSCCKCLGKNVAAMVIGSECEAVAIYQGYEQQFLASNRFNDGGECSICVRIIARLGYFFEDSTRILLECSVLHRPSSQSKYFVLSRVNG